MAGLEEAFYMNLPPEDPFADLDWTVFVAFSTNVNVLGKVCEYSKNEVVFA